MEGGHFRYKLDKVETKVIPGKKKYVAQVCRSGKLLLYIVVQCVAEGIQ